MTPAAKPQLRVPSYAEQVSIDSYKGAAQSALSDATAFGDKVVAAAVSIGTAYGAVIALVAPKSTPSAVGVAAPFVALAAAVALALYAQSISVNLDDTDDLAVIRQRVADTIRGKRMAGSLGLVALIIGLVWAGVVVHDTYGKPPKDKTQAVTLWLSDSGKMLVTDGCKASGSTIAGRVKDADALGAKSVAVRVDKQACPAGAGTLVLPKSAINVAKLAKQ